MFNVKELALVDPDDYTPVETLCKFYNNPVHRVLEDTTLDVMLETFKQGKTHIAFVQKFDDLFGDGHLTTIGVCVSTITIIFPTPPPTGLVTLEDVLEEIIQAEITDEMDVDNVNKEKFRKMMHRQDFSVFRSELATHLISPQLRLAAFQFLAMTLKPFSRGFMTANVLHRLINYPGIATQYRLDYDNEDDVAVSREIYSPGRECDYFVLILEGRVEVCVGKEGLTFQGGPFSYFGISSLKLDTDDAELYKRTEKKLHPKKPDAGRMAVNSTQLEEELEPVASEEPFLPRQSDVGVTGANDPPSQIDLKLASEGIYPISQTLLQGLIRLNSEEFEAPLVPDYYVRANSDLLYLKVSRAVYLAAFRASQYERMSPGSKAAINISADYFNRQMRAYFERLEKVKAEEREKDNEKENADAPEVIHNKK